MNVYEWTSSSLGDIVSGDVYKAMPTTRYVPCGEAIDIEGLTTELEVHGKIPTF